MDFFETRERYRRREMKGYVSLLMRVLVVGGVLWVGWLWGHAETGSLRAEAIGRCMRTTSRSAN